jgi:hypothetical protein
MQEQYDPAELHVDGGSEQRRRDKKQNRLDDVWTQRPVGAFGARPRPTGVPDELDCNELLVS